MRCSVLRCFHLWCCDIQHVQHLKSEWRCPRDSDPSRHVSTDVHSGHLCVVLDFSYTIGDKDLEQSALRI